MKETLFDTGEVSRGALWDALAVAYWPEHGVPPYQTGLVGRLVSRLQQVKARPEDIAVRRRRLVDKWSHKADTACSLVNNWQNLAEPINSAPGHNRPKSEPGKYAGM